MLETRLSLRNKRLEHWTVDRGVEQRDDLGPRHGLPLDTAPNRAVFERGGERAVVVSGGRTGYAGRGSGGYQEPNGPFPSGRLSFRASLRSREYRGFRFAEEARNAEQHYGSGGEIRTGTQADAVFRTLGVFGR
jgi:hypothetical protein